MAPAGPPPPSHLSASASKLWRETLTAYDFAAHELEVLRLALEAMDRAGQARRALRREGLWLSNRFGDLVPHLAIRVEKDSAAACARMLALLDLPDIEQGAASTAGLRRVA